MAQQIILTVGASCSGKTTWTEEHIAKNTGKCISINRDDLRKSLFAVNYHDYKFTSSKESMVTQAQLGIAEAALKAGQSVIISDTNLDPNRWQVWQELAKKHKAEFVTKPFPVELKELLKRNIRRDRSTPESVIRSQVAKYEKNFPLWVDYWMPTPYVRAVQADCAYIFDVDGTLAHMHGKRGPFEWSKVGVDDPDEYVIELLQALYGCGFAIIIMSGRSEECRQETADWLSDHGIDYNMLLMRPANDYRPDTIIKDELFEEHLTGKYDIMGVFDDRDCVVEMWRKKGLKVMQVEPGDF